MWNFTIAPVASFFFLPCGFFICILKYGRYCIMHHVSIKNQKNPCPCHARYSVTIAKFSITRTWLWSRYWNNHYRYKHATWYVETGRDDVRLDVLIFLKFKFSNGFFVKSKKNSPNILNKICQRYGKIRSLNCGENLSSDHTMTIPKWVWGLILPLVRSNDR